MEDNKIQEQQVVEETKKEDGNAELQTNEENGVKTYSKEEYDKAIQEARKNGIAEGMRKGTKQNETDFNAKLDEANKKIADMEAQIKSFKNIDLMNSLNVDPNKQSDLLAIIRGNGEEVNEETIAKYAEKHPEWIKEEEESGIETMGQTKTTSESNEIAKAKEEKYKKMFRL